MAGETVWLLGMMGAGKSRVGPLLARELERPFVDADAEIERAAGCSVGEIFAREGEAGFRRRERDVVEKLGSSGAVVALGGGAVTQAEVRTWLASGRSVHLRARPETLLERLGDAAQRPLLAGLADDARLARLRELLAERAPGYATAEVAIDTDGLDPEAIAREIAAKLGAAR